MDLTRRHESPHGDTHLTWEVDEYPKYKRSIFWYLGAALVVIGLLWYALATGNFLFALIVIIFAIVVLLTGARQPRRVVVALTEDGIELGTRFHPWNEFETFWVVYDPPMTKNIYLAPRSVIQSPFALPLEELNPNAIREILLTYIREDKEKEDEPVMDIIARILKI